MVESINAIIAQATVTRSRRTKDFACETVFEFHGLSAHKDLQDEKMNEL